MQAYGNECSGAQWTAQIVTEHSNELRVHGIGLNCTQTVNTISHRHMLIFFAIWE